MSPLFNFICKLSCGFGPRLLQLETHDFFPASPPFEARGSDHPHHKQPFDPRYGQPASSWLVTQRVSELSKACTSTARARPLPANRVPSRLLTSRKGGAFHPRFDFQSAPLLQSRVASLTLLICLIPSFLPMISTRPQPWQLRLHRRFPTTTPQPRKRWVFVELTASLMDS